MKAVYHPKAVIPIAALLHQVSATSTIFTTAPHRRSLGRISVPVWPVALSGRLPVEAMVGHHPTIKLIGREPIPHQKIFQTPTMQQELLCGISPRFRRLSHSEGQVTHVLLTRSPLIQTRRSIIVRLACVKHAASVRPEPGSNSPSKNLSTKSKHPAKPNQKSQAYQNIHSKKPKPQPPQQRPEHRAHKQNSLCKKWH